MSQPKPHMSISVGLHRLKLMKDLALLSGGELLGKVAIFGAFAYLARVLGPEAYGTVEFTVTLCMFFTIVVDGGLGPIGVRKLAGDRGSAARLAIDIPVARLMVAVVAIPLMGLTTLVTDHSEPATVLIWLYAFSLLFAPWNQQWLFQGLEMMGRVAAAQLLRALVFACGVILVIRRPEHLWIVGIVEVVATLTVATYYVALQRQYVGPWRFALPNASRRALLLDGASVGLANVVWAFHQCAPVFMVTLLVGDDVTAWYGSAHRIVFSLLGFSALYFFNIYPAIARCVNGPDGGLSELLGASYCVVAWTTVLLSLLLALFAGPFMVALFGPPFREAGPSLALLIWVLPATMLSGHARWSLIAAGHQRYVLVAQLGGALVMLLLGAVLIPHFGAPGAASAALAASFVVWGISERFAIQQLDYLPFVRAVARPVMLAVACWALAVWQLGAEPLAPWFASVSFVLAAPLIEPKLIRAFRDVALAKAEMRSLTLATLDPKA